MASRGYGRGTIARRAKDALWVGRIDLGGTPRRRKVIAGKDRSTVEAKMDAWLAANTPHRAEPRVGTNREEYMRHARSIATHTAQEWRDKVAASRGLCHYCHRPVAHGGVKDHVVPVSRGGSDGIDNVVYACWDCNDAKRDMDADEFRQWARECGFFSLPQCVTVSISGRNRRIPPDLVALMRVPRKDREGWLDKTTEERTRLLQKAAQR